MLVAQCPEQFTHAARFELSHRTALGRLSRLASEADVQSGHWRPEAVQSKYFRPDPMCGYVTSQKNRELSV